MFGNSPNGKQAPSSAMETVIGTDSLFQGSLSSKGSIRIDGKVEGGITEANAVVIGATGEVQGDVTAKSIVIAGKVVGNLSANSIEILADSHITGDIKTVTLAIAEGASFEGNCTMAKEKQVIEMDVASGAKRK